MITIVLGILAISLFYSSLILYLRARLAEKKLARVAANSAELLCMLEAATDTSRVRKLLEAAARRPTERTWGRHNWLVFWTIFRATRAEKDRRCSKCPS